MKVERIILSVILTGLGISLIGFEEAMSRSKKQHREDSVNEYMVITNQRLRIQRQLAKDRAKRRFRPIESYRAYPETRDVENYGVKVQGSSTLSSSAPLVHQPVYADQAVQQKLMDQYEEDRDREYYEKQWRLQQLEEQRQRSSGY